MCGLTESNYTGRTLKTIHPNPQTGGLLREAVKICNLFIEKNELVVETKGRNEVRTQTE